MLTCEFFDEENCRHILSVNPLKKGVAYNGEISKELILMRSPKGLRFIATSDHHLSILKKFEGKSILSDGYKLQHHFTVRGWIPFEYVIALSWDVPGPSNTLIINMTTNEVLFSPDKTGVPASHQPMLFKQVLDTAVVAKNIRIIKEFQTFRFKYDKPSRSLLAPHDKAQLYSESGRAYTMVIHPFKTTPLPNSMKSSSDFLSLLGMIQADGEKAAASFANLYAPDNVEVTPVSASKLSRKRRGRV